MKTGGIYLFNTQNDNYQIINTNHGLPSMDFVIGFSEDQNGDIFFCNGSYLVKANENTEIEGFYDIASDDEALYQTYYIKKTNEVYVVSDKGFYRFFPDNLKPNLIPPKMALDILN